MHTDHPAVVALTRVLEEASDLLSLPVAEIAVQSLEAREWRDSCLDLSGNGCNDVPTPGFRIVLGSPAGTLSWRTDQQGKIRREFAGTPGLGQLAGDFVRSGGLIGRPSELHLNTATMPTAEAAELKRLVAESDFWNTPSWIDNGEPIPDGYSYGVGVTISGRTTVSIPTREIETDLPHTLASVRCSGGCPPELPVHSSRSTSN